MQGAVPALYDEELVEKLRFFAEGLFNDAVPSSDIRAAGVHCRGKTGLDGDGIARYKR